MSEHKDLRRYPSLRKHVDELLAEGAVITDRDPTTLIADGQALKARCGMLVGDDGGKGQSEAVSSADTALK